MPVIEMAATAIRNSGVDGLDVLPAGLRRSNPAELLAGPRLAELLAWAETIYDQILVDTSPLLATSDATIVGRLLDGLILVVQPLKNPAATDVMRAAEGFAGLEDQSAGRGAQPRRLRPRGTLRLHRRLRIRLWVWLRRDRRGRTGHVANALAFA